VAQIEHRDLASDLSLRHDSPSAGAHSGHKTQEREDTVARGHEDRAGDRFEGGNVLELVTYQTGAVVSREIMKKQTGTVTVFAFDKGQGLSEHSAPFDALVQVLDGIAEIAIGGVPHRVGRDEMILMPANVPHAVKAVERMKMLLVMIREPTT
jgi:quercetin dioxygenase-like cupin family protein